MNSGWLVITDAYSRHVMPAGDLREHEVDEDCWCEPFMSDGITVHNSADGREGYERGERRPS